MAARVFLLSVLFTVGLSTFRSSEGLEVGLGFASEPNDAVVSRNRPLLLNCEPSHSTNNTTVHWTFNNDLVIPDTRRTILNNGSLYIKKVLYKKATQGVSDIGVYRCLIRNSYGTLLSRPAHVRLASIGHEFAESPANISVQIGEAARLQCHIESTPLPLITWERNSHPLPQNNRYITLNSGILIIRSVDSSDEGEYRCIGTNEILNKVRRHSAVGQLTVRPRSPITADVEFISPVQPASVKRVMEGSTATLDCVVSGRTTDVTWTYKLPNQTTDFVSEMKRSVNVLTLHNVTQAHEGAYTCTAIPQDMNTAVDDEMADEPPPFTRVVTLEVLSPPLLVKKPKSQVYPTAKTVRIECEAKGNPLPEIVWLKNGQTLRINGRVSARNQSLVISNSVSDDTGIYQCVLNNSVGGAWAAARVFVNVSGDQPMAPTRLHCSAASATQVTVTWHQPPPPPPTNRQVQAYTVHYVPTDGGEEMRTVSLNRSFTVSNLLPFTNYTFYIRAYDTKSASDQSLPVTCLTGEEVPVGAPEVNVVSENPTSLSVSWTPLSSKVARGRVSEYKIQWRRNDHHSTNNVDTVKEHVTHYLITGLQPDTKYEVRVLAATEQGWPSLPEEALPWSLVQTLPVEPDAPLLPMPALQLVVLNATTILVKWSLEPVQQKVDGFHFSYRKQNGELLGPELIEAGKTEHVLADLEPQTWYEVVMSGISSGVEGESAVRSIQTWASLADEASLLPLPAPTHLLAEPISPSAINLTWQAPPHHNISHYTLSYHVVQTALPLHNSSIYFLNSTSTGVQITGLKPYTLYELKVKMHDNDRHSEYSQKLECRTLEDLPGAVYDVQWKLLNTTSVRISWKEPVKVNGVIANYTLAYSPNPNQPLTEWTKTIVPATKLSANLTTLKNNRYTLKIWASSGAGPGPPSPSLEITIPSKLPNGRSKHPPKPDHSTVPKPDPKPDQILGIVIGCVIGASCIIMCTILLVYRHKCTKPGPVCRTGQAAANGSTGGFYLPPSTAFDEMHEMECFTGHLDTKGGFPQDQVNGLKLTLLTNGRIPNGHATRERDHGVRITENPQFNSPIGNLSPGSCDGVSGGGGGGGDCRRVASDEGDSLLSGHQEGDGEEEGDCASLNDTQLTTLDCCQTKAEQAAAMIASAGAADDDDGFHENETHRTHHHLILLGPNG